MRIATWNINGVKARIDNLLRWLKEASPDVVCLQEIKCQDEGFPAGPIEELGYQVAVHGQKGFHGVALLSKSGIEDVQKGLPPVEGDIQSRFVSGLIANGDGVVRVASCYMPNGNPIGTEKFAYKLAWLKRLEDWARAELEREEPLVIAGDYNIIATPLDAKYPNNWVTDALYTPEARAAFRRISALGLTDGARRRRRRRHLHLLGLPGRRLAAQQRHPHRPHPPVAGIRRSPPPSRHRPPHPRLGEAVRPRAGLGGAGVNHRVSDDLELFPNNSDPESRFP